MMAGFRTLARLLAICIFLGLLCGYVSFRHDQAKREQARLEAIREAREKAAELVRLKGQEDAGVALDFTGPLVPDVIMSSSKNPSRVLLPGSKSPAGLSRPGMRSGDFAIVGNSIDEILAQPSAGQQQEGDLEPKDKERVLLPGSKYAGVGIPPGAEDLPIIKRLFKDELEKSEPEAPEE